MKWVFIVLGVLALLVASAFAIGFVVPREHTASRAAVYQQPPAAIWEAITRFEDFPRWRSGLEGVRAHQTSSGTRAWVETSSFGDLPLEVVEEEAEQKLVLRIASADLPFGGTWTYLLEPAGEGTRLTITEHGFIDNALFRFMARFVFGYTKTIEDYLLDLGRKFGQEVALESPARQ
jgi:hypothetical protein